MADSRQTAKADVAAEKARAKALRPWYRRKRFVIPVLLLVIVIGAAIAGGGDGDSPDAATGDTKESVRFPGRPDAKKADIERNVGESAELSGYTATVESAGFQSELNVFEKDGYLLAEVTLLNRDDEAQSYNTFEWKLITPAGQIIDPSITGEKQLGHGDLAQGGTVSGKLIWEVGNQKGDYYVVYDPSDFGDERAVWKVVV